MTDLKQFVTITCMPILLSVAVTTSCALFAQSPGAAPADLTSSSLQVNGTLPQNNTPKRSSDLLADLNRAQARATASGISSDTLLISVDDEAGLATPAQILSVYQKMTCDADAIVAGHTDRWMAHLTAPRTNIYTGYDFVVDQIVKNNAASPLGVSRHVVVTRPGGGPLQLGTGTLKNVEFRLDKYPALQTNREYMIFLEYVAPSGAYQLLGANGTLILSGGQWTIARKALSGTVQADFAEGALEKNLSTWLSQCGH